MPTKLKKYITIDPEILGGTPVISGTRIPVIRIKELVVKQGYNPRNLKEEYPQVDVKKIQYIIDSLLNVGLDEFEKAHKTHATA